MDEIIQINGNHCCIWKRFFFIQSIQKNHFEKLKIKVFKWIDFPLYGKSYDEQREFFLNKASFETKHLSAWLIPFIWHLQFHRKNCSFHKLSCWYEWEEHFTGINIQSEIQIWLKSEYVDLLDVLYFNWLIYYSHRAHVTSLFIKWNDEYCFGQIFENLLFLLIFREIIFNELVSCNGFFGLIYRDFN
jgi:hypothetical protein